eukprot:4272210-Amphidinium_carterae.1
MTAHPGPLDSLLAFATCAGRAVGCLHDRGMESDGCARIPNCQCGCHHHRPGVLLISEVACSLKRPCTR